MTIVAIYTIPADKGKAADTLSRVTGASKYEAVTRLNLTGKRPIIIGAFADPSEAREVSGKLDSSGFGTIVLDMEKYGSTKDLFSVKTFSFEDTSLHVLSRQGDKIVIAYDDVSLILCGKSIQIGTETVIEKTRKLSLGRAVMTSGLMMTRKEEKHRRNVTEEREGFINLYGQTDTVLVFRENDINYSSLGAMMKPSRHANFSFLAEELKKRCTAAAYDDSLMNKIVQTQILGPLFEPEAHLDIAVALLASARLADNA